MNKNLNITGLRAFVVLSVGQTISLFGSNLSGFALGFWVFEKTGSVMNLAIVFTLMALPGLFLAPIAGVLVDRWDRRWIMILGDTCSAASTVIVAWLLLAGQLNIWHVYLLTMVSAVADTFQRPAFGSIMPALVPKQQLGRVNGFLQAALAVSQILGPLLAGALVVSIKVQGVLVIDFITYLVAVSSTLIIRIPKIAETTSASDETPQTRPSLWGDIQYGWKYLLNRQGLLALLMLYTLVNFLYAIADILIMPLALSITSPAILGSIMAVGGIAMVLGSLLMGVWGGPKRHIYAVIGFMILGGLAITIGGSRPSVAFFFIAAFIFFFAFPIINTCAQTILQLKVAPEVRGRVFAFRGMLISFALPIAYLTIGPLADVVFEPAMAANGVLAGSVGLIIGVGPGRGIGLIFVIAGLLSSIVAFAGLLYPRLRNVDTELPDMIPDSPAAPVSQGETDGEVSLAEPSA